MRLKNSDYTLLKLIQEELNRYGRDDLTIPLGQLLREFEEKRDSTRKANRERIARRRKEGTL